MKEKILEYFRKSWHPQHSRTICKKFSLSDNELRKLIRQLRREGNMICSSNNGYWITENKKVYDNNIKHQLGDRAINMLSTMSKSLRRRFLKQQYKLEFKQK